MTYLTYLRELAKIDKEILVLNRKEKEIPLKIKKPIIELSADKNKYMETVSRKEARDSSVKDLETELDNYEKRLEKIQKTMREVSGAEYNKHLKELSKTKKEIDLVKKRKETIELKQKEQEEKMLEQEAKYKESLERYESIYILVKDDLVDLREKKKTLLSKREKFIAKLDSKTKEIYTRAYKGGNGIGISFLVDNRCSACNIMLRPSMVVEILKEKELQLCSNCFRIIIQEQDTEKSV